MRITTLCLAALTLLSPLSAAEVQVNIPLENLSISQEGIFLLTDQGETIPLQQLCHDHHGYYTTCCLSLKKGAQPFYQGVSPQMITFLSQLLTDPATWEELCLALETDISLDGRGGTDNWEGSAKVEIGDSDSRVSFVIEGDISHSSGGTDGSVSGGIEVGF